MVGDVRAGVREGAVVVPEAAVVRRPAGLVVYRVADGVVEEVPVTTGIRSGGEVEILAGIRAGDRLALDGAGYLTGGAAVEVRETVSGEGGAGG